MPAPPHALYARGMPELPDVEVYVEALRRRVVGRVLLRVRVKSPFVVRSVEPGIDAIEGVRALSVTRLGKRVVLGLERELCLVVHLMIAGRFRWDDTQQQPGARASPSKHAGSKIELARFEFESGTLILTEAGTKKRAAIHVVRGEAALRSHNPGGVEVLSCTPAEFEAVLHRTNRTLKRALTDPAAFSGIGNAYSDEILHRAKLSPFKLTRSLDAEACASLHAAASRTLREWSQTLRREFGMEEGIGRFPGAGEITAFRDEFAVHGKFGKPCPVCGKKVQRVIRGEGETNYCAMCQTGGKVLSDRSLARLLGDDWPDRIEDWE